MENREEIKIIGVDVANTSADYTKMKKEFENQFISSLNLKLYQKIYLKILQKTNGLFSGFQK